MDSQAIAKKCADVSTAATEALVWIDHPNNAQRILPEKPALERALRRVAFQARRLQQAVNRPMCVGVFGPSQNGKSYLVSVLARKSETLTAVFDDSRHEIDYITDINPPGGKEATGLVTRFSIHPIKTPPGFPVALRLLNQTDVVKILANSYCYEGDPEFEHQLTREEIESHITELEKLRADGYVDQLREEDVWDLQEYVQKHLRRFEAAKALDPVWDRIARIAPRLTLSKRAELYALLWGRHAPLTALYLKLTEALARLGFADEAYCQIQALVPSANSILNVATLSGVVEDSGDKLKIMSSNGVTELPRAVISALTAELRIVSKERPWDFFQYTDLLDFPGYRSRKAERLPKMFVEAPSAQVRDMLLRGKVDFLFQRYTADQELTSMLLCLRDSNLDVVSLPAVIEDWIGVTHGHTPEERAGRPVLLFFLLTFFDMHLIDRAGDERSDGRTRFEARMHASLLHPFGKTPDSWPLRWTPDRPFDNCFWIRNPNVKAEGIIEYEGTSFREARIRPDKEAKLAELRGGYATVPEVQQHFRDPLRAWDEVMRLNDGGVSYLAENLAKVCLPNMKTDQVQSRLTSIRKQIAELLARFYVSTDIDRRVRERMHVAIEILRDIDKCVKRRRFGSLISGLGIDRVALSDALFEWRSTGIENDDSRPYESQEPSILDELLGEGWSGSALSGQESRFKTLADVAIQTWTQHLHDTAEDEPFARALGMRTTMLRELVAEIANAARRKSSVERKNLADKIADRMDALIHIENKDAVVAKATIIAERIINRFVSTLGFDGAADRGLGIPSKKDDRKGSIFARAGVRHDASGIGEKPAPFGRAYVLDWCTAFQSVVRDNASTEDGSAYDPEQNRRLGGILARLEFPVD